MRIKVRYMGTARIIVKKKEEELDISHNTTLLQLLQKLATVYGEVFRKEVFHNDGEIINELTLITINGIPMTQLNSVQTKLKMGDVVTLLPFFIGGG